MVKTASTPGKPATWTRGLLRGGQAAGPVFLGLPAAALDCSWRSWRPGQRTFALYSASTAVTMTATTALASAGFSQAPRFVRLGGLFQRASIITGFAWLTALSTRSSREKSGQRCRIGPEAFVAGVSGRPREASRTTGDDARCSTWFP